MKNGLDRKELFLYMEEKYSALPDYPWKNTPDACVFRHSSSSKWFALFMSVSKNKLGFAEDTKVDILNLKCDPMFKGALIDNKSFFTAYHMNKEHWITILLSEAPKENVLDLIDLSYDLTAKK